jgi:alpha-tubulin suppressor-like RCC1 family protein
MNSILFDIIPEDLLLMILEYFPCQYLFWVHTISETFNRDKILSLLRRRLREQTRLDTNIYDWKELENLYRLSQVNHISAGDNHSTILSCEGKAYFFGADGYGQLGLDYDTYSHNIDIPILFDNNIVQMVAGAYKSLALTNKGEIKFYGVHAQFEGFPSSIQLSENIIQIASTCGHVLILTEKYQVYGLGNNFYKELGLEYHKHHIKAPELIPGISDVIMVATGYHHSLVLTKYGTVYGFGSNRAGQLGLGSANDYKCYLPIIIPGANNIVSISAGSNHSLFLDKNGKVYSCGYNCSGQLGLEDNIDKYNLVQIQFPTKIAEIAAGDLHSLALTEEGSIYSFGDNRHGKLGLSCANFHDEPVWSPTLIPFPHKIISIAAGMNHSLLLTLDGQVYSFGCNSSGELGLDKLDTLQSDIKSRFVPTLIPNFHI